MEQQLTKVQTAQLVFDCLTHFVTVTCRASVQSRHCYDLTAEQLPETLSALVSIKVNEHRADVTSDAAC